MLPWRRRIFHERRGKIFFAKFFLLFSIFIAIGFFCYFLYKSEENEQDALHIAVNELKNDIGHALKPQFKAFDDKGRPYIISATSAVRGSDDKVELEKPSYALVLGPKTKLTAKALKGHYDETERNLFLKGEVVVSYGQETKLYMPEVHIDLKLGDAFGSASIHGVNPRADIRAGSFMIQSRGNRVILTDHPILKFKTEERK